jgi:uncharacterized protein YecT (DUF1311 family)
VDIETIHRTELILTLPASNTMTKLFATAICMGLFLFTVSTPAQNKKPAAPCVDAAQTQVDLNNCAHEAYVKADNAMNITYKKVIASLTEDGPQYTQKLKAAQLLWIKYRDATCESESALNEGGTIYPMVYNFCLAGVTDERNTRLKDLLKVLQQ